MSTHAEVRLHDLRAELAHEPSYPSPMKGTGPQAEVDARVRDSQLVHDAHWRVKERTRWLESAADLLAEPDPGETPFVINGLIVQGSVAVIQGPPKSGKTFAVLEMGLAITTGKPVLDRFHAPVLGPVMVVCEESGRAALQRRLRDLCRAKGLDGSALADLRFAANRRVRLDDSEWQARLTDAAVKLRPRAIFLDPIARMKGAARDENSQKEMAVILDYLRDLRDASGAAVVFVHHTGHEAGRLRGTSDLEALWESKVTIKREGGDLEMSSEHREAEPGPTVRYRLQGIGGGMRLIELARENLADLIAAHLRDKPGSSIEEVAKGIERRKDAVRSEMRTGEKSGLFVRRSREPGPTGPNRAGQGWYLGPDARTGRDGPRSWASGGDGPGQDPLYVVEGPTGPATAAGEEPL